MQRFAFKIRGFSSFRLEASRVLKSDLNTSQDYSGFEIKVRWSILSLCSFTTQLQDFAARIIKISFSLIGPDIKPDEKYFALIIYLFSESSSSFSSSSLHSSSSSSVLLLILLLLFISLPLPLHLLFYSSFFFLFVPLHLLTIFFEEFLFYPLLFFILTLFSFFFIIVSSTPLFP